MDTQWLKRETKFRAIKAGGGFEVFELEDVQRVRPVIDWETISQFTGLKDVKGVEIYEGDVVQCFASNPVSSKYRAVIEWVHGGLCMRWLEQNARTDEGGSIESILHNIHIDGEVIGNVFENPELIK